MSLGKIAVVHFVSELCCSHWADLCAWEIWQFCTHHTLVDWPCITCSVNLLWWGSISSVMPVQRTHWQCHGCMGCIYNLCLASCLPHVLYSCAIEASKAEQVVPLPVDLYPCFQKTQVSWAVWHRNWWVNDWSRFTQNSLQKFMCCQNRAVRYV